MTITMMNISNPNGSLPLNFFSTKFGGKSAFLATIHFTYRRFFGAYSNYEDVRLEDVSRLIFVCKGNICRSAYAAEKARQLGRNAISAGLAADPGKHADPQATKTAIHRLIDLSDHRSQSVYAIDLQKGDCLIAFEPSQALALTSSVVKESGAQVTLMGLWHPQPWWSYLHDPYGLSETYFDHCFDRIELSLAGIVKKWDFALLRSVEEK